MNSVRSTNRCPAVGGNSSPNPGQYGSECSVSKIHITRGDTCGEQATDSLTYFGNALHNRSLCKKHVLRSFLMPKRPFRNRSILTSLWPREVRYWQLTRFSRQWELMREAGFVVIT